MADFLAIKRGGVIGLTCKVMEAYAGSFS